MLIRKIRQLLRHGKPRKQQRRRLNLNVEVLQAAGSPTANKAPKGEEMEGVKLC